MYLKRAIEVLTDHEETIMRFERFNFVKATPVLCTLENTLVESHTQLLVVPRQDRSLVHSFFDSVGESLASLKIDHICLEVNLLKRKPELSTC